MQSNKIKVEELKSMICEVLQGIDKTETESEDGWWETSTGAEFGRKKLESILELLDNVS